MRARGGVKARLRNYDHIVDAQDAEAYARALRPGTRILDMKSPANPNLAITDIESVVGFDTAHGRITVLDNTFATPFAQTR